MRIPRAWVPIISRNIIDNLISRELIELNLSFDEALQKTEEIILDELLVEDRLNDEVREILKAHEDEIEKKHLDYKKLFEMTKKKFVKERNIIL